MITNGIWMKKKKSFRVALKLKRHLYGCTNMTVLKYCNPFSEFALVTIIIFTSSNNMCCMSLVGKHLLFLYWHFYGKLPHIKIVCVYIRNIYVLFFCCFLLWFLYIGNHTSLYLRVQPGSLGYFRSQLIEW